jgi:amidase
VNAGATFITCMPGSGDGVRLAVKDLIDVAGVPTTAGSRALAATAAAELDAPCLAGARAAGARIVGKTNLSELAYGASGVNEYFGTPVNPLDPGRVPGGSSSGSAVAVAGGEADLAYGSDTGGSIRVPAAFCGITGLKTTHGRIPLAGVWPLAPSMDTIGPMARDMAGVAAGLALLEPGFSVDVTAAARVGRIRPAGFDVDPVIDAAVDAALARCGVEVVDVELPGWDLASRTSDVIIDAEAVASNRVLLADPARRDLLGPRVRASLAEARAVTLERLLQAPGRAGTLARHHGGGNARDRLARAPDGSVLPSATRCRHQAGLPRAHQARQSGGLPRIGTAGAGRSAVARQPAAHRRTERGGAATCHRRDDRGSGRRPRGAHGSRPLMKALTPASSRR